MPVLLPLLAVLLSWTVGLSAGQRPAIATDGRAKIWYHRDGAWRQFVIAK